jgi:hypothetical protein
MFVIGCLAASNDVEDTLEKGVVKVAVAYSRDYWDILPG